MRAPDARRGPRTGPRSDQPSQPTDIEHATRRLHVDGAGIVVLAVELAEILEGLAA